MAECVETTNVATLVLASGSPRRRKLLDDAGLIYHAHVPGTDEDLAPLPSDRSVDVAMRLAAKKLADSLGELTFAGRQLVAPDAVVIAADTIVDVDGTIRGKPADRGALAEAMASYSGEEINVVSAVALARRDRTDVLVDAVTTRVRFRRFSNAEIATYVASSEGLDKAGGLALQGGARSLIESVDGCWTNVVGLPLCATERGLRDLGQQVSLPCLDREGRRCQSEPVTR